MDARDWGLIYYWLQEAKSMYYSEFYTGSKEQDKELAELEELIEKYHKYWKEQKG